MGERLAAHPGQQLFAIGGVEHFLQSVAILQWPDSRCDGKQVQIVIAEQRDRLTMFDSRLDVTQRCERFETAIDEVADEDVALRSRQLRGELLEARQATLHIADRRTLASVI